MGNRYGRLSSWSTTRYSETQPAPVGSGPIVGCTAAGRRPWICCRYSETRERAQYRSVPSSKTTRNHLRLVRGRPGALDSPREQLLHTRSYVDATIQRVPTGSTEVHVGWNRIGIGLKGYVMIALVVLTRGAYIRQRAFQRAFDCADRGGQRPSGRSGRR